MTTIALRVSRPTSLATSSALLVALAFVLPSPAVAELAPPSLRLMPPDRTTLASGQRFDIRVEATPRDGGRPVERLEVFLDGRDITSEGTLAEGPVESAASSRWRSFTRRAVALDIPGLHTLEARASDGATATVHLTVEAWADASPLGPRARNVILLLGDGMGAAHRTAARLVSKGLQNGKARGPLAMDTLEVTGQVMTSSLNAVITDSAPGMSSQTTGAKANNNQEGVFPDNTPDAFDNPRVEYLGEILRRVRGPGFRAGLVTTADITDATPAANAVHTADRNAGPEIAAHYLDERETNGVTVLLGGGSRHFLPRGTPGSSRTDDRDLGTEFTKAGFRRLGRGSELRSLLSAPAIDEKLLGLFSPSHMPVAFDKVGAGRYSEELALPKYEAYRDQPMLDEMARLALRSLSSHSPAGFFLMVEGASIDKKAHDPDAERMIWDAIEFDRAVAVALEFARRTNGDSDPDNDTLVVVSADHECGGLAIIGVGNERFSPSALGHAVRDYAAVFRFAPEQQLNLVPNYEIGKDGYPVHPDPSRKLLLGWAAAPDRFENWLSNRRVQPGAFGVEVIDAAGRRRVAIANRARDGAEEDSDNRSVEGQPFPGFPLTGAIENGDTVCVARDGCPADTGPEPHALSGHTATDIPLSASGPGALQFTGTYENTDVFIKILRSTTGAWASHLPPGLTP